MRYRLVWATVGLVAATLLVSALLGLGVTQSPAEVTDAGPPPTDHLVTVPDGEGAVWPYTSRKRSTAGRTLAINVLVRGDPARTRTVLEDRSNTTWTPVDDRTVVGESPWIPARGAARYGYVAAADGSGQWVEATYQLGVGPYFGHRTHVRAYPAPAGNWTALQAHTEYWDWFRLRHTVTGVAPGARFVERDLRDEPFVAGVSREYHGLEGGGSDGWLTVVELAPAVVAGVALPVATRRVTGRELVLPVALVALVLGVRGAGLAAEALLPAADPKLVAATLYPVVAAGPPLVVGLFARDGPPSRVALLAAGGFGAGLVLDFGVVGVEAVSVRLALHRVALTGALAALALGVARDTRTVWVGLGVWTLALAGVLFGVV